MWCGVCTCACACAHVCVRAHACVCLCSNANPLHYYVPQVLHKAIDSVECGLVSNLALLGQTTLHVGRVSV